MDEAIFLRVAQLIKEHGTRYADVFDIDGTLVDDNLLMRTTVALSREVGIDPLATMEHEDFAEIAIKHGGPDYARRLSEISLDRVKSGFYVGLHTSQIKELQYIGLGRILKSCFGFPRALILALRQRKPRRLLIGISGMLQEIADVVCLPLGLDLVIGIDRPKVNGIFVEGKVDLSPGTKKGEVMNQLSGRGIIWDGAIALGDTKYDWDMFELASYPIGMNPKPDLQRKIREKRLDSWPNGRVAWMDQTVDERPEQFELWHPNDKNLLEHVDLSFVLPEDAPALFRDTLNRMGNYAS